jgi:hypothetical protein
MSAHTKLAEIARSPGDPRVHQSGPSSLTAGDQLARALGWFSVALGVVELLAPRQVARAAGLEGKERLVRAYGARELMAAVPTLSVDKKAGLGARIAGDLIDIATLLPALGSRNPRRANAMQVLMFVSVITVLDVMAYGAVARTHDRGRGPSRDYGDRSGFPKGIPAALGVVADQHQKLRPAA